MALLPVITSAAAGGLTILAALLLSEASSKTPATPPYCPVSQKTKDGRPGELIPWIIHKCMPRLCYRAVSLRLTVRPVEQQTKNRHRLTRRQLWPPTNPADRDANGLQMVCRDVITVGRMVVSIGQSQSDVNGRGIMGEDPVTWRVVPLPRGRVGLIDSANQTC